MFFALWGAQSLLTNIVISVAVVVSIVYISGFYAITNDPAGLTIPFVILMIIATIIPIGDSMEKLTQQSK